MSAIYSSNRSSWEVANQRSLTTFDWSLSFWTNAALATVRFTFVIEQGKEKPPNNACTRRVGGAAFSGVLCGLKLVPAKWRCLVPGERRDGAQSRPPVPRRTAATRRAGHTHRVLTQTQAVGRHWTIYL